MILLSPLSTSCLPYLIENRIGIDKDYFEAQENRFRRECFREVEAKEGTYIQKYLF